MKKVLFLLIITLLAAGGCIYYASNPSTALPPVINGFSANPVSIPAGGSATLTWNISGVTTAYIDQGIGNVGPSGSQTVSPASTTTYTVTASNAYGIRTAQTQVLVTNPVATSLPVISQFFAAPTTISTGGGYSTLYWNVSGATSVTISGIGTVGPSGKQDVYPVVATTYTMTATNSYGTTTASTQVIVGSSTYGSTGGNGQPVVEIFMARPDIIRFGDTTTLTWNVTGSTSVYITGLGSVSATGSVLVHPYSTTNYTIAATNAYGTTTSNALITVTESPYPPFPPTPPNYPNY
jgi:hypothetical protein